MYKLRISEYWGLITCSNGSVDITVLFDRTDEGGGQGNSNHGHRSWFEVCEACQPCDGRDRTRPSQGDGHTPMLLQLRLSSHRRVPKSVQRGKDSGTIYVTSIISCTPTVYRKSNSLTNSYSLCMQSMSVDSLHYHAQTHAQWGHKEYCFHLPKPL